MFRKKEYKISLTNDEWVTPEETLLDSGSEHSDLERPISHNAFRLTLFSAVLMFGLVLFFSFRLAVSGHESYARLAFENKTVNFFISPPRGIIFDRLGKPLAQNTASFDLLVISKEIREFRNQEEIDKIADTLKISRDDFNFLVNDGVRNQSVFFAAKELNRTQVLELNYLGPKGFYVVPDTKRSYTDGHQFSSVLGYIGKVSREDLQDTYYRPTDMMGRLGIERQYEEILRGEHGKIFFSKDSTEEKLSVEPVPGRNLVLNIDYDLQKKLYNELYGVLVENNLSNAAAVIQNPSNGQVLAMVSFPSYNNNLFTSGLSDKDYKNLFESKTRPLFNRAVGGQYNPGSTIKPFVGLAALQEGIFKTGDTIRDCISLVVPNPYNPDSPAIFRNWREDTGLFNLRRAIAESCNIYFFIAGGGFGNIQGLGITKIADFLKTSWADRTLGIDLPGEARGFVPTPDWKREVRGEAWYQGDTYNVSIGQGDLVVTPLWLNAYVSAIANGGTVYRPQVAQRIVDEKKNDIMVFQKEALFELPFEKTAVSEMKSNMEETVLTGTAKLLQNLPVRAGAKTGTAEVVKGRSVNALFTAFAPYENPEFAITILVEGASTNQGMAIVAADRVMKWYFDKQLGIESEPLPL